MEGAETALSRAAGSPRCPTGTPAAVNNMGDEAPSGQAPGQYQCRRRPPAWSSRRPPGRDSVPVRSTQRLPGGGPAPSFISPPPRRPVTPPAAGPLVLLLPRRRELAVPHIDVCVCVHHNTNSVTKNSPILKPLTSVPRTSWCKSIQQQPSPQQSSWWCWRQHHFEA